jgi:hypothetical protein
LLRAITWKGCPEINLLRLIIRIGTAFVKERNKNILGLTGFEGDGR